VSKEPKELVRTVGEFLERRTSRRGFFARSAAVGSAVAAAPVGFLLYADPAEADVHPGNCAGKPCADGYTEFCCSAFGSNECPAESFYGGYWKCTNYTGRGYCSGQGVRYYIDCNAIPGVYNDHCGLGRCSCRAVFHNHFQYGNCNTHRSLYTSTYILCRKVLCHNPGRDTSACSKSNVKYDPATCRHHACTGCL